MVDVPHKLVCMTSRQSYIWRKQKKGALVFFLVQINQTSSKHQFCLCFCPVPAPTASEAGVQVQ